MTSLQSPYFLSRYHKKEVMSLYSHFLVVNDVSTIDYDVIDQVALTSLATSESMFLTGRSAGILLYIQMCLHLIYYSLLQCQHSKASGVGLASKLLGDFREGSDPARNCTAICPLVAEWLALQQQWHVIIDILKGRKRRCHWYSG